MKTTKKILAILLSVCMVITLTPTLAWAEGEDSTLPDPVNGVITLTENVTLSGPVTIGQDTTVDLAGYTLTGAATVFDVTAGTLTIRDSSEGKAGKITISGPGDVYGVQVAGTAGFKMESGTLEVSSLGEQDGGARGVYAKPGSQATIEMSGGSIVVTGKSTHGNAYTAGLWADCGDAGNSSTITISGGSIDVQSDKTAYGIWSNKGNTTVTTKLYVTGGTIMAKKNKNNSEAFAIQMDSDNSSCTISDGCFTGIISLSPKKAITGGLYSNMPVAANLADSVDSMDNPESATREAYPYVVAEPCEISFVLPEGAPAKDPVIFPKGKNLETAYDAPPMNNQILDEWCTDEALQVPVEYPMTISGDTTLYGKYKYAETLSVSFDFGIAEKTMDPVYVIEGTPYTPDFDPSISGLIFRGWYLDEEYTQAAEFPVTVNENITLYAKYEGALYVGGIAVTKDNAADLTGAINEAGTGRASGKASYSFETGILSLDGFSYKGAGYMEIEYYEDSANAGIYSGADLTVSLAGKNAITMEAPKTPKDVNLGILVYGGDLALQGDGELSVITGPAEYDTIGIEADEIYEESGPSGGPYYSGEGSSTGGNLTITGCNVKVKTADSEDDIYGIYADCDLIISGGSKVDVKTGDADDDLYAIEAFEDLTIGGASEVSITTGDSDYSICGLYCDDCLTVSGGSTLNVTTGDTRYSNYGIYPDDDAVIEGGSTVKAVAGKGSTGSYGLYAYYDLIINGGSKVNAVGGTVEGFEWAGTGSYGVPESCGIYVDDNMYVNDGTIEAVGGESDAVSCGIEVDDYFQIDQEPPEQGGPDPSLSSGEDSFGSSSVTARGGKAVDSAGISAYYLYTGKDSVVIAAGGEIAEPEGSDESPGTSYGIRITATECELEVPGLMEARGYTSAIPGESIFGVKAPVIKAGLKYDGSDAEFIPKEAGQQWAMLGDYSQDKPALSEKQYILTAGSTEITEIDIENIDTGLKYNETVPFSGSIKQSVLATLTEQWASSSKTITSEAPEKSPEGTYAYTAILTPAKGFTFAETVKVRFGETVGKIVERDEETGVIKVTELVDDVTVKAPDPGPDPSDDIFYDITVVPSEEGTVTSSKDKAKKDEVITLTVEPKDPNRPPTVVVTDKKGNEVPVTEKKDGTYTFKMPASPVEVTLKAPAKPHYKDCPKDHTCPIWPFKDSNPKDWYHDGVHWAIDEGIMNGIAPDKFAPNDATTRAMIVTMLWRLEGKPAGTPSTFKDLEAGSWYEEAVNWAEANGIVKGYNATTFGPKDPVLREQLAAILYRYAEYKGTRGEDFAVDMSKYTDFSDVSDWAVDAVTWCVGAGIINGMTETTIVPQGTGTRAQMATMLMRYSN